MLSVQEVLQQIWQQGLTPDTMDMKMMGAMSAHSDLTLQPCSPLDVAKSSTFPCK